MQKNNLSYHEADLIASLQAKDHSAFGCLYDHYHEALYRAIKKILPDDDDASDTLQDVFINIYRKIETYDPSKGRLFTWMLNISVNASIDRLRSSGFRHIKLTDSLGPLAENKLYTAQMTDHIGMDRMLGLLSDLQRDIIDLSYFKGYTHEQISIIKAMPVGTVKSRIRNALVQLKQFLVLDNKRAEAFYSQ